MKSIVKIAGTFLLLFLVIDLVGFLTQIHAFQKSTDIIISPLAEDYKNGVQINQVPAWGPTFQKPVDILLLGFDGRKGDKNPRCDAIHMLNFNPNTNKITITNVPRGTKVTLPTQAVLSDGGKNYLSNACHIIGVEKTVKIIETIVGNKSDYVVKVGFSQTLGLLRSLGLPTTPTLQFLRSRQYGIGDYQRSKNQANFLKDMISKHTEDVSKMPQIAQYLAFNMVDTDMPFEIAAALIQKMVQSGIYKDPDNIILVTKPSNSPKTKTLHFDEEKYEGGENWQNDEEFYKYQENLATYLTDLIKRADSQITNFRSQAAYQLIKTPFSQKIWLQVENEKQRNQFHFEMLRIYAFASSDKKNASSLVLDFTSEMEEMGQNELMKKARQLLNSLNI